MAGALFVVPIVVVVLVVCRTFLAKIEFIVLMPILSLSLFLSEPQKLAICLEISALL